MSWNGKGQSVTTSTDESTYEWVPGEGQGQQFSEPQHTAEGLKKWAIENYDQKFNDCVNSLSQAYINKQPRNKRAGLLARLRNLKPFTLNSVNIDASLTAQEIVDKYHVGVIRDGGIQRTPAEYLGGTVDVSKTAFVIPKELYNRDFEWLQWKGAIKPVNNIGRSFIHEAGNLASYYLLKDFYAFGDPNDGLGDTDSGQQVSKCVFGVVFPPTQK